MLQPADPTGAPGEPLPRYGPQSLMIPGASSDLTGYDDGQLAGVAQAVQQAQIERMRLALPRASSPEVQRFARDALQVHRGALLLDRTTFVQLKVTPTASPVSEQVLGDWQRDETASQAAQPFDFDRFFVDHQVELDQKALALLDSVIGNAKISSLKSQVQSDRASLAGQLTEARHLQQGLR
jgi:predicted outer membrane protein